MANFEEANKEFWKWLLANDTTLCDSIAIKDYRSEGAGRGVIATKDIKEGELLFSLPRSVLLSTSTSSISKVDGLDKALSELKGWTPLIITMMYESQKEDSFWKPYFNILPRQFSTPMFWEEADLKELEGSDILAKIGKSEAEETFINDVKPIIENYPGVFNSEVHNLELYHICGSLIMAYSFNDEFQSKEKEEEEDEDEDEDEEEEEGGEEAQNAIIMVPMADMLNHKTGYNNARLFHESECLQMRAIKDIKQGEQIYNTYGDLCNADLLRKYGFVDEKNIFDLVELDGQLIVEHCNPDKKQTEKIIERKIDFLMEEGVLDECFVIDTDYEVPSELIVSVHVLCSTLNEFQKMEEKQKLPKARLTHEVKQIILKVLNSRLSRYSTTLEDDEIELKGLNDKITSRKRNALLVRIGEKKIIKSTIETLLAAAVVQQDKRPSSAENIQGKYKKQKKH